MKYSRVVQYATSTPWALHPPKLMELLGVLAFRAEGGTFTPEELRARLGDDRAAAVPSKRGAVAVIPIKGVIANRMTGMDDMSGGTSAERISAQLRAVADDPQISTIVYDIDSSGGTVPGIQELAAQMFALRGVKHQVAHVNDLAASAAYWLASQADEIVSTPSGSIGSIGVWTAHSNFAKALEIEGVEITLISAGKYKIEGNPFQVLGEEAREVLKTRVDVAYKQFTADVARGRGVSAAVVRNGYGEGRALSAVDAKAAGLIDGIATLEATLSRVAGGRSSGRMRAEVDEPQLSASAEAIIRDEVAAQLADPKSRVSLDAQQAAEQDAEARGRLESF